MSPHNEQGRTPLMLLLAIVAVALGGGVGGMGGCAADPVRIQELRALRAGAVAIGEDAALGRRVRATPELAAAAGVPRVSDEAAALGAAVQAEHAAIIERMLARELGARDGGGERGRP